MDARIINNKGEISEKLVRQVSNPVLFQQSIEHLIANGVDTFIEVGPSKSAASFVKRTAKSLNRDIRTFNIENIDSFRDTVNSLKGCV